MAEQSGLLELCSFTNVLVNNSQQCMSHGHNESD